MKLFTAAIIRDGEDILVLRRGAGDAGAGLWEFPGGPVEHPESIQESLERELFALLDIATRAGQLVAVCDHSYEGVSVKLVAMETEIVRGTITLSVHDKMRWLPPTELMNVKLAPAAIPIAHALQDAP